MLNNYIYRSFVHAKNRKVWKIMQYTIRCGKAEGIVDTLGGELISYKVDGKEYLWTGDEAYWTGHAPVLFPYVSALKNDSYAIGNKTYTYKGKHGFARKTEFELIDASNGEAIFLLTSNEETRKIYPFDFELYVTHTISETGFETRYTVKNPDSKDIMFCIGGHPGFIVDGSLEDYRLVFEKSEDAPLYYTDSESLFSYDYKAGTSLKGETFDFVYSDYDVDALLAIEPNSKKVSIVSKKDNKGLLEFDFSEFKVLVIWTPPKKQAPFVCLEPWNGLPAFKDEDGQFASKPYLIKVGSGDEYSVGYKVKTL